MSEHVMVRLDPAERERAAGALRAQLAETVTVRGKRMQCWSSAAATLIDVVRLGPRGYTMAMDQRRALDIADALHRAGQVGLAHRFLFGQRAAVRGRNGNWRVARPPRCTDGHRPDDDPEPGDRCKDCGQPIVWTGPGLNDWTEET